jgi:hypothetical protein
MTKSYRDLGGWRNSTGCHQQSHYAEQRTRRRIEPKEMRAITAAALRRLNYLVFDRNNLVAAFAWLDDAEQWIEEYGHPTMRLHEVRRGKLSGPISSGR